VTDPVTHIFSNSGEIEYTGVEATASYQFAREWTILGAGMWLKAEQKTPDPTFDGLVPENTPDSIGNMTLQYRPVWVPGLMLNAGASAISRRYVNNQQQGTIPGYTTYSIGGNYATRIDGRRVSFQLSVDNLSNLRYWNSVQTGTYGIGMDRSFRANMKVDF
jgi:iron complex outermembrane receptor protein